MLLYPLWHGSFDYGYARIPQTLVERGMHRVVGTADDEVNDLDGSEDDV